MIFHAEHLVGGGDNHFFAFRLQAGLNEDGFHAATDGRRAAQGVGGIERAMEHRSEAADDYGDDSAPAPAPRRSAPPPRAPAAAPRPAPKSSTGFDDMDDDIPF